MGLQAGVRSVRGSVAVAAVVCHGRDPARGARPSGDARLRGRQHHLPRVGAGGVRTRPPHRVTIPASVRETDGMLLFVTSNKALATSSRRPPAGRWKARGSRAPTPRPSSTARSRRPTTPAATQAVDFTATTKSTPDPARLRRHRRRPGRGLRLGRRDGQPRHAHDAGRQRGDRRLVRRLLLGGQVLGHHRLDPPGRPDPAQPRPRHRRRADHLRGLRPATRQRAAGADHRPAPPPPAPRSAKATMWTVVLAGRPDGRTRTSPRSRRSR